MCLIYISARRSEIISLLEAQTQNVLHYLFPFLIMSTKLKEQLNTLLYGSTPKSAQKGAFEPLNHFYALVSSVSFN